MRDDDIGASAKLFAFNGLGDAHARARGGLEPLLSLESDAEGGDLFNDLFCYG